ncbi:MAG: restriction endonuclease subunit S [Bacilli bacterium]
MKKKLNEIANIKFCLATKSDNPVKAKTLTPINLLENNTINEMVFDDKQKIDDSLRVTSQNIIIKRIVPSFVNYIDEIEDDVYAGGNLILINNISVNPKYLSCILNEKIKNITQSLTGATIPAISRRSLEEVQIPIPPMEKQIIIGELWYKNIELKKLKDRLATLEMTNHKYTLNQIIDKYSGGK